MPVLSVHYSVYIADKIDIKISETSLSGSAFSILQNPLRVKLIYIDMGNLSER